MRSLPRSSILEFASGRVRGRRSSDLDVVFFALSDPTRRAILDRLSRGEASVTELAKPFRISLPAISKHLRILEDAGIIRREKIGRVHRLQLAPSTLISTLSWMEHYRPRWQTQLDSLSAYLEREKKGNAK